MFFYIIIIPICILLHEVGHGLGAVITSNGHVQIYLGPKSERNKENFRVGRLHFHILWSYVGFAYWQSELSRRQKAASLAGGPFVSLLLTIIFGWLAVVTPENFVQPLFWWTTIFNFSQVVVTVIPVTYPKWMGRYSGFQSDGLQLYRLLKERN
ncbi:site-2 protease family protein [Sporosarcina aquimarina]|uniref:site-2 protease family protein n=1 Tax=Sporosarcina aquimarina TaxID=114975 RepID=UPI00295F24E1|nr:site-2 protease family protein [Sporosarcina aquimarina]